MQHKISTVLSNAFTDFKALVMATSQCNRSFLVQFAVHFVSVPVVPMARSITVHSHPTSRTRFQVFARLAAVGGHLLPAMVHLLTLHLAIAKEIYSRWSKGNVRLANVYTDLE